jgi:hypothetical protein
MRILPLLVVVALGAFPSLRSQVPSHATLLNPTINITNALVLQDGDTVHVFGNGAANVLHARSLDGGRTWPVVEVPLSAYSATQGFAAGIAGSGNVLVLGYDQFVGPRCWRSADGGTTWSSGTPLSSVAALPGPGLVAVLADGLDVVAVWLRIVGGGVSCRRSVDGGATWSPEQPLHAVVTSQTGGLRCHRNGNVLDVIWGRDGDTVHQRSTDGGTTWLPAPHVLAWPGPQTSWSDGTNLLVVTSGILWRSTNGGASWTHVSMPGFGYPFSIAGEGTRLVLVGTVTFSVTNPTYAISVSSDSGLTWSPALLLPSPVGLLVEPHVAAGVAYVAFAGIYLDVVTSRDGGASWQLVEGPATLLSPGPRRNVHVALVGAPIVRCHAYVGLGSSVLGTATPGSGGIAPRVVASGLPFRGTTTTLECSNAVGGSVGAFAVSFAPPAPLPFAGGIVWPTVAPLLFAFATGGLPGQPGTGGFALPVAVPTSPAVVGTSFVSQAVVLDAAATGGIALGNAIETWLR